MRKLFSLFAAMMISLCAFAQSGNVSGKVTESSGDPVIGAVVYYEGTNVSAVTNANGEYSIKAMVGKELTFSCFGLRNEVVKVAGQAKINVVMKSDNLQLEDAVVIGYGSQQRQDLTGSIASVKADELRKAGQNDILGSLQGKVAGLNITTQSGEPGTGYNIKIRGNNSINAATTPLVVIDGMQMDINTDETAGSALSSSTSDPLAFLNPVDIQSIEVLKDASATAIYGARGANGVILITTKSGAENNGKTVVTFDAKFGLTTLANDIEMLSGQEWINYRFERGDNKGTEFFGKDTDGDGINDTPKTVREYNTEEINWRDALLRKAFSQNYNVSVRSNIGKNTQILASVGYLNQQGMIKNNDYKKLTAKVKLDHNINKAVKIGANANYMRTQSDGAASSTGGGFNNSGLIQAMYLEKPLQRFYDPSDPETLYTSSTSLIDCINSETYRQGIAHKILGNVYLDWKIIPDLTFRAYASGNVGFSSNNEFYSINTRWGRSKKGVARYNTINSEGYTANATLAYRHSWNKAHNFDAMAGVEMNDYIYNSYAQEANNFEDDSLRDLGLAKGTLSNPTQSKYSNGRMSAFGRVNYNYKYRYYITGNFRADGSSKFSAGSRVGYFPSVSAAWRISNEKWMSSAKKNWLDNLKLRLSAGVSGNDRISNYANLSTLDKVYYADATGTQILGMTEYSAGNAKLKWETTWQYDAGLDFTLWKGRVDFTFDAYYKDTRDMLFKTTLPSQTGFTSQWANIGRVENKGFEFSLSTVNVKRGDFSWSTNITFDLNRNKIVDLGDGVEMMPNNVTKGVFKEEPTRLVKGQPIGIIYGYVWDGNYQLSDFDITYQGSKVPVSPEFVTSQNYDEFTYTLKEGVTKVNGVTPKPGDRKYKDLDGDGVIYEANDKTVIGNCYPQYSYAFGNTFSWRGFSLYVFFDGVKGRDLLNEFKARSTPGEGYSTYMYNITKESYYGAWRPENGSNTYARLKNQLNLQQPISSYYVEDASFLRLKTAALSYSLPSSAVKAIHFSGLKFTLSVDNVYTWTKYTGIDPDLSSTNSTFPGLDRLTYPTGRTYSLSIIANF